MRMTAPSFRSWSLQTTSLTRNVVAIAFGLCMGLAAALRLSSARGAGPWIDVPIVIFASWIGVTGIAGTVTLCRFPQLRGVELPLRPVTRRALQAATMALVLIALLTAASGVVWWLTEDLTPWAAMVVVGALVMVGIYFTRYLLLNRARNEALVATGGRFAGLEPPAPARRAGSGTHDGAAIDGE